MEILTRPATDQFKDWLRQQREERDLTYSKLAEKSGFSRGHIHKVLSSEKGVSINFCIGLATALQIEPLEVLQVAGFPVESVNGHIALCIQNQPIAN